MILKLFGFLDLITGIFLILLKFGLGKDILLILAFYLLVKGIIFLKDVASFMDIVSSIFIFLAIFGVYNLFTWIIVLWLIQKGIFSMVS